MDDLKIQKEWAERFTLEQRVAALEHALIAVQRHLGLPVTALEQLKRATEGFKEFPPEFLEEMDRIRQEVRREIDQNDPWLREDAERKKPGDTPGEVA
jgi:hypothetical protein